MSRRFLGPVHPIVGPDFVEPVERFRLEFLRRECAHDPRVAEYLARLDAQEKLPERVEELEKRLNRLARAPRNKGTRRKGGVPL